MKKTHDNEELDALNAFALLTQIGLTLGVPIIIGIVIGRLIDNAVGSGYLFLFIFLMLGIVGGFYACYRELNRVSPIYVRKSKRRFKK